MLSVKLPVTKLEHDFVPCFLFSFYIELTIGKIYQLFQLKRNQNQTQTSKSRKFRLSLLQLVMLNLQTMRNISKNRHKENQSSINSK